MSSIFEEIDLKANQGSKFWCPLEEYSLRDIIENTLFRSKLKISIAQSCLLKIYGL